MTRLLIAIRPADLQMMSDVLGKEFDAVVCTTLQEALAALDSGVAAIGCGLHFDEGKMFDLLRHAKEDPRTRSIPFFCLKGSGGDLSPAILQSIRIATQAMGADGFLDISAWRNKYGDAHTYARLRKAIRVTLAGTGPAASDGSGPAA